MKLIVVTGGVLSGLGKGVSGASLGLILGNNQKIVPIKLDGYLNSDPGTMNPIEHGEVFVLDDGSEVDMDFGHYERYLNYSCSGYQSITMGKIYKEIWEKERKGDYLGRTVQLIPHVTNLIKNKILEIGNKTNADIVLLEIGGTIGDLENDLFVEAIRQLKSELPKEDLIFIHLTYVPIPYGVKEQKTKPTQQSVRLLKQKGIDPDVILCRCSKIINEQTKTKISLFSNISKEQVLSAHDVKNIYQIPIIFENQGLGNLISKKLNLNYTINPRFQKFKELVSTPLKKTIRICIAGKYTGLEDSYASIVEAIKHCDMFYGVKTEIIWIDTTKQIDYDLLDCCQGIIVPGGFGSRGVDGKLDVIKFARQNHIPYLGICYGMQLAVIEFARNVCKYTDAHTTEINKNTRFPFVTLLDKQKNIVYMGGTMRLGSYDAVLKKSKIGELYRLSNNYTISEGQLIVKERHRHRYEVNPVYHSVLEENGLYIVGKTKTGLAEFIELVDHPYFVATQAHPELKSKPDNPAPLFRGLFETILHLNYD